MQAIVLAGGLGTRLRSAVSDVPKPMAPIGGRPFLTLLFEHLANQRIENVILSVGYKRELIITHIGSRYKTIVIDYSIEESALGTGGAIRQALNRACFDPVFCLNGDTFLGMEYADMLQVHQSKNARITVALKKVSDVSRYGKVILEKDQIISFQEKGGDGAGFINGGVYILSKNIFDDYDLPTVFSFEKDFLHYFCATHQLQPYCTEAYFIDIGTPEEYSRAAEELKV